MLEAGPVSPKTKGTTRWTLDATGGFGFDGGHLDSHGVSAAGEVVEVPLHAHEVSLDFLRLELEYEHTFRDNWDVWARLPYEIKDRSAGIVPLDTATPEELAAMQRNLALHHRARRLDGVGDARVLVARRLLDVARSGDALDVAFGTTLPTGRTEDDPFEAGDAGEAHEHVQFGNGTLDPVVEVFYTARLGARWSIGGFGAGRYPLYDNHRTYRGSPELSGGFGGLVRLGPRVSLQANLTGYYQGFAEWDGARDVNSGLRSLSGLFGVGLALADGTTLNVAARQPIVQETLLDSGDGFELGPTLLLQVSRAFGGRPPAPQAHEHHEE